MDCKKFLVLLLVAALLINDVIGEVDQHNEGEIAAENGHDRIPRSSQ